MASSSTSVRHHLPACLWSPWVPPQCSAHSRGSRAVGQGLHMACSSGLCRGSGCRARSCGQAAFSRADARPRSPVRPSFFRGRSQSPAGMLNASSSHGINSNSASVEWPSSACAPCILTSSHTPCVFRVSGTSLGDSPWMIHASGSHQLPLRDLCLEPAYSSCRIPVESEEQNSTNRYTPIPHR